MKPKEIFILILKSIKTIKMKTGKPKNILRNKMDQFCLITSTMGKFPV
jgi:hypothetical protein